MVKTRSVDDLYRTQEPVKLPAADGGEIELVMVKLNKLDLDKVFRAAGAFRSIFLAGSRDRTSEVWRSAWTDLVDAEMERADLIRTLIQTEVMEARLSAQAEREGAVGSEWGKDGYLQGLSDAWEKGLKWTHAENPDDDEATRVFAELSRFNALVDADVAAAEEDLAAQFDDDSDAELLDKATAKLVENRAEAAWSVERDLSTLQYATRHADNRRLYFFRGRDEVGDLEDDQLVVLLDAYERMTVGITEGKDSRPTEDSSPSSEPPAPEGTSEVSGLATAPA